MFIFYVLLLVGVLGSTCPSYTFDAGGVCMPCGVRCSSCTSNLQCSTCSSGFYLSSNGSCLACQSNCQTCNQTACTACSDPFILNNSTQQCQLCTVPNAVTCSSLTNVTGCSDGYYSQETSCGPCVLHCKTCLNSTTCQQCHDGYLLQYQYSVCSSCKNCRSCYGTLANCTSCWDGYRLLQNGASSACVSTVCSISNCLYCTQDSVCGNCRSGYYLSSNACYQGASLLCSAGAAGSKPFECSVRNNQYNVGCWAGGKAAGNSLSNGVTQFTCLPLKTLSSNTISQIYLYMYNDYVVAWTGANSISLGNDCSDEMYVISPQPLYFEPGPYYRIGLQLKLYSLGSSSLLLILNSGSHQQNFTVSLTGTCNATYVDIMSTTLAASNLTVTFSQQTVGSFGLIEVLMNVSKCSSSCLKCLNPDICIQCLAPLYQYNYNCIPDCMNLYRLNVSGALSCVLFCPEGYYNDPTSTVPLCKMCSPECRTCSNFTTCFSCQPLNNVAYYYFSANNTCLTACPTSYFPKGSVCMNCLAPCKSCLNQTTCLSCLLGYWNGTNCAQECPPSTYGNSVLHSCSQCSISCLNCYMSSTFCTSCSTPLILFQNTCLTACRDGYYLQAGSCSRCVSPCKQCSNSSYCLSCSFGYLNNGSCTNSCPAGQYPDLGTFSCLACNASCTKCSSASYCTECPAQAQSCLSNGVCNSINQVGGPCIATYFPLTVSGGICVCTACLYPCLTCNTGSQCLSCVSGYLSNSRCTTSCPSGYFGNDTSQQCQVCSSLYFNCKICTFNNCSICQDGYFLNIFQTAASLLCINSCPAKMYSSGSQCHWCVSPCSTCTDQLVCLTCVSSYSLNGTKCLRECGLGYYSTMALNGSQVCAACVSPCLTCSDAATCLSCLRIGNGSGQTYYNGTNCAVTCSSGSYPDTITLRCEKCLSPCKSCTSQSNCLSCAVGFFNPTSLKCQQCAAGTYPDSSTQVCLSCPTNCDMCLTASTCSHCTNSTYLYNQTCISAAACSSLSGYYLSLQFSSCSRCLSPCNTCLNETECLSCLSGYMFFNNSCIVICPTGYYGQSNAYQCASCSQECLSCVSSSNTCLSCASGYLYYRASRTCLLKCPSQTYQQGTICLDCKYPCLQCISQVGCLSCQNGIYESKSQRCISMCPSGQYPASTNSSLTCENCSSNCYECSGAAVSCAQCPINMYLFNSTCTSGCPNSYFADTQIGMCFSCISPCLNCLDQVSCTTCSDIYVYSPTQKQCLSVCPQGYFNITNTNTSQSKYVCASCMSQCLTCNSSSSCILCKSGVQLSGLCLANCPSRMFAQAGTCFNCSLPCLECVAATICSSCPPNSGYLLVAGSSCIVATTCPEGFYLVPNSSNCSSTCGDQLYKDKARRACVSVCPSDHFITEDRVCVERCPSGYYGNSTYKCVKCDIFPSNCMGLLNFNLSTQIIEDRLYLYVMFSIQPQLVRSLEASDILLLPTISLNLISANSSVIVIELLPQESIQLTLLQLRILNPFSLFSNASPLQNPVQTLLFAGFDRYSPSLPDLDPFGKTVAIVSTAVCLSRGYFALDYLQNLFAINLVSIHNPQHFRSFLQAFRISHLWFPVAEVHAPAVNKFKTAVSNMSLLQNTLYVFIVFGLSALSLSIVLLVRYFAQRRNPSEVDAQKDKEQHIITPFQQKLNTVVGYATVDIPLRLLYIFYAYLSIFTVCEIYNFSFQESNPAALASRYLSVPLSLVLLACPIILLNKDNMQHKLMGMLLLRKLVISISLVAAMAYPVYVIGLIMVVNMCTLIILPAQKPIAWKVQLYVCCVGEIVQVVILCLVAGSLLAGEGYFTNVKVTLSSVAIFLCAANAILYTVLNALMLVLWVLKLKGRDYIAEWTEKVIDDTSKSDSENDIISDAKLQHAIEQTRPQQNPGEDRLTMGQGQKAAASASQGFDVNMYETFRVYPQNDSEADQSPEVPPPAELLVRVVTKFDDFEPVN